VYRKFELQRISRLRCWSDYIILRWEEKEISVQIRSLRKRRVGQVNAFGGGRKRGDEERREVGNMPLCMRF
jgi:hypothetical protein